MIHETVPYQKSSTAEIREDIVRFVLPRIRGRACAKTSDEIADMLGMEPRGTNQPIRKVMKELLVEGVPIVSCTAGFYVAESSEDLEKYVDNLTARQNGLARDIAAVNDIIVRMRQQPKYEQTELW